MTYPILYIKINSQNESIIQHYKQYHNLYRTNLPLYNPTDTCTIDFEIEYKMMLDNNIIPIEIHLHDTYPNMEWQKENSKNLILTVKNGKIDRLPTFSISSGIYNKDCRPHPFLILIHP